jgi:hypothetical protein
MSTSRLNPHEHFESDVLKAFLAVRALVIQDVIQKAKQYDTYILLADEHGNTQRVTPHDFEASGLSNASE